MNKTISFKTSGLSGDIIHYLAGIKQVCKSLDAKADIFVWLDQQGFLYDGAEHPYGTSMMNQYAFNMMLPLVESQEYVNSFQVWCGQEIAVDLDKIREVKGTMPYGSLSRWIFQRYPDMTAPLHEPWLHIPHPKSPARTILINRTSRYRNPWISYFFLEKYIDDIFFVGLEEEYKAFKKEWGLDDRFLMWRCANFLELADLISVCRLFIGNQSLCFAIAEALKVPRILETCHFAPNVIPTGPGAHDFIFQEGLTYLVDKLNNDNS
jgi:hypothetical protein